MRHFSTAQVEHYRATLSDQLKEDFGIQDPSGIEIFLLVQMIANSFAAINDKICAADDLSSARWQILMHLYGEEKRGSAQGITPTMLSHSQRVSKNTISVLLRGLEEQGLVKRDLDANDYRKFHIELTDAGREYITQSAPGRLARIAGMAIQLSPPERQTLVTLLIKLHSSLMETCQPNEIQNGG